MNLGKYLLYATFCITAVSAGCAQKEKNENFWRGVIHSQGQEVPFNFLLEEQGNGFLKMTLINGEDRMEIDSIVTNGDSVEIPMLVFDAYICAEIDGDRMEGRWIKPYAIDYKLPFTAQAGEDHRFLVSEKAGFDASGKWEVLFYDDEDSTISVGQFKQNENRIVGSFALSTGDYRFLEGVVSGDSLFLSAFDGTNAYLFKAGLDERGGLNGEFISGKTGYKRWTAIRNEKASLPNPGSLTLVREGRETLGFTLPSLDGSMVSLSDERFKNKAVIVQIMGSWCANCMDETRFLAAWHRDNRDKPVEIVALAFERKDDFAYAKRMLSRYVERFDIQYPILFAGVNNRENVAIILPEIDKLSAYPTTIFLDKNGKIRKIHTGFNGPATGSYYERFVEEFNSFMSGLMDGKEK